MRRRIAGASRQIAREVGLTQPPNGTATSVEEALEAAERIGYPVLVRPSYVLGGRAMQIVYDAPSLENYFATAARASEERPVLIDRFLEDAFEVRRGCDLRRQRRRDRRHHAAHRGRRHPLRRLGLRAAAVSHRREGHADDARADDRDGEGAQASSG